MNTLLELYREQIRLLEELLELLRRDAQIIKSGSVEALDELIESNKKKETLALKVKVIEEEKRRLEADQGQAEEFEDRIRAIVQEIAQQGERNRVMLEGSLSLVRAMLGVLLPPQAYTPQGRPLSEILSRSRGKY